MDYHLIAFRMKKRHEAEDKQRFVNAVLGSDFKPWSFEEKSLRRHMFLTMPEKNYPSEEDFLNAVHGTVLIANDIIDQKRTENPIYWTDERTSLHKEEAAQKILTHMVAGLLDMYYGKRNANIYDIKTFLSLSRPTDRSLGSCLSLNGLANFVKIVSDAKEGEIVAALGEGDVRNAVLDAKAQLDSAFKTQDPMEAVINHILSHPAEHWGTNWRYEDYIGSLYSIHEIVSDAGDGVDVYSFDATKLRYFIDSKIDDIVFGNYIELAKFAIHIDPVSFASTVSFLSKDRMMSSEMFDVITSVEVPSHFKDAWKRACANLLDQVCHTAKWSYTELEALQKQYGFDMDEQRIKLAYNQCTKVKDCHKSLDDIDFEKIVEVIERHCAERKESGAGIYFLRAVRDVRNLDLGDVTPTSERRY